MFGINNYGNHDVSAHIATSNLRSKTGQITGDDMERLIREGAGDLDFNSASSEYRIIREFAQCNQHRMTDEAKAKFAVYEQYAQETDHFGLMPFFFGNGPQEHGWRFNEMLRQMEAIDFGDTESLSQTGATSEPTAEETAANTAEEAPPSAPWTAPVNVASVRSSGDIYVLIAQAYRNREVEAENQAREVVTRMETTTAEKAEIRVLQRELQKMRATDSFGKADVDKLEGMMKERGILAEGDNLWKDYGFDESLDEYEDIMGRSKEPDSFDSKAIPLKTTLESNDTSLPEQEKLVANLNKKFDALEKLVESFMNELGDSDMEINFQLQNASNDLADAAEAKSGSMKLRNRVRETLRNNVYNG